jgi:hypothetical protein
VEKDVDGQRFSKVDVIKKRPTRIAAVSIVPTISKV